MTITDSCAAGREMPCTSKQPIIYLITRTEIGFTDRPRDIQNLIQLILPIEEYCVEDLVLRYSSRILGCKQKCRIEPLQYRLVISSRINYDASPQLCLESRNEKRIDMRMARTIKPNRVYDPIFLKKRKEVFSAIDVKRIVWGPFI